MIIQRRVREDDGVTEFFFSGARRFDSIPKLVSFYRSRDLTENFDYSSLKGLPLRTPYKSV